MVSPAVVVLLGLVAYTYTAPESGQLHLDATGNVSDSISEHDKIVPVKDAVDLATVQADDDKPAAKRNGYPSSVKKGDLDRGLVSDVIQTALGGMQLGLAVGSNNGTLDRLCIKLGNITMAGCRRTALQIKKISKEDVKDDTTENTGM